LKHANNIKNGSGIELSQFDNISTSLNHKLSAIKSTIENIQKSVNLMADKYSFQPDMQDFNKIVKDTGQMILNSPDLALSIQGNLKHELLRNLID
jgi:hypothetical protein